MVACRRHTSRARAQATSGGGQHFTEQAPGEMYFTPSEKTYAWSGAGPALLHTPAFGPTAGQIQVSPVGTTIAGVTLTTLGHAPPGSDFQNVDGGPHQTLARWGCPAPACWPPIPGTARCAACRPQRAGRCACAPGHVHHGVVPLGVARHARERGRGDGALARARAALLPVGVARRRAGRQFVANSSESKKAVKRKRNLKKDVVGLPDRVQVSGEIAIRAIN